MAGNSRPNKGPRKAGSAPRITIGGPTPHRPAGQESSETPRGRAGTSATGAPGRSADGGRATPSPPDSDARNSPVPSRTDESEAAMPHGNRAAAPPIPIRQRRASTPVRRGSSMPHSPASMSDRPAPAAISTRPRTTAPAAPPRRAGQRQPPRSRTSFIGPNRTKWLAASVVIVLAILVFAVFLARSFHPSPSVQLNETRQTPSAGGIHVAEGTTIVSRAKAGGDPYANLDHLFRVQAWGWTMPLDSVDTASINAFYQEHVNKGPEQIP